MLLVQQINGKETEIGTWYWMTEWNVHKTPKMCGNVEVAAISLDRDAQREEDFDTKRCCPEFLRKARRWQTDCSGIQGWLIDTGRSCQLVKTYLVQTAPLSL